MRSAQANNIPLTFAEALDMPADPFLTTQARLSTDPTTSGRMASFYQDRAKLLERLLSNF